MENRSFRDIISENLGRVPLEKRKNYIILVFICISISAIVKTILNISHHKTSEQKEWMDDKSKQGIDALEKEYMQSKEKIYSIKDSLDSLRKYYQENQTIGDGE